MSEKRYDAVFIGDNLPFIDYHFCRGLRMTESGDYAGCYGTDSEHGSTFEEAKREVIEYLKARIEEWEKMTEEEFERNL